MTIQEMAIEYRRQYKLIRGRIRELNTAMLKAPNTTEIHTLRWRVRILSSMARDVAAIAIHLERNYRR